MNERRRVSAADLKRIDDHAIRPEEYDDLPELTEADFARASLELAGVPVKRGRPRASVRKVPVTIRLSPDVVDHFRASGPGWQTRIDETLRQVVKIREAAGR